MTKQPGKERGFVARELWPFAEGCRCVEGQRVAPATPAAGPRAHLLAKPGPGDPQLGKGGLMSDLLKISGKLMKKCFLFRSYD